MKFHMENGFELELEPINYLFIHTYTPGGYCLGIFDNGSSGTLLGGITFRNVLVQVCTMRPNAAAFACLFWHINNTLLRRPPNSMTGENHLDKWASRTRHAVS